MSNGNGPLTAALISQGTPGAHRGAAPSPASADVALNRSPQDATPVRRGPSPPVHPRKETPSDA